MSGIHLPYAVSHSDFWKVKLELGHGCQHLLEHIHKLDLKTISDMSRCCSCQVSVGIISAYSRSGFGLVPNITFPLFQGEVKLRQAKLLHFEENHNHY